MIAFLKRIYLASITPVEEQRPLVNGQEAWERFQQVAEEKKQEARKKHGRVKAVEAAQRSLVHASLALAVPTAGHGPGVVA